MLWLVGAALFVVWFVLTFLLHKAGFVHMLLLASVSLLVVQIAAHRKTKLAIAKTPRTPSFDKSGQ
jgi:hypothetical protein